MEKVLFIGLIVLAIILSGCVQDNCAPGYLNENRCLGNSVQQKYQNANCTITWQDSKEPCLYGCVDGKCVNALGANDQSNYSIKVVDEKGEKITEAVTFRPYCAKGNEINALEPEITTTNGEIEIPISKEECGTLYIYTKSASYAPLAYYEIDSVDKTITLEKKDINMNVGCFDSDERKNYFIQGYVTGINNIIRNDDCIQNAEGLDLLEEYYCGQNGEIYHETIACPQGYTCYGGVCTSTKISIEVADVYGNKIKEPVTFTFYCSTSSNPPNEITTQNGKIEVQYTADCGDLSANIKSKNYLQSNIPVTIGGTISAVLIRNDSN